MNLSPRATALLTDFARQQGLQRLEFNDAGLIPIRLDKRLEIAIGYSPANDALYLFGTVAEAGKVGGFSPWAAFMRNPALSPRRTRLYRDTDGHIMLSADLFLEGLDYQSFAAALDRFVLDLDAEIAALAQAASPSVASTLAVEDSDMVLIRI